MANLICQYKGSCVVHVGAGLSTAAGIRDFRGKGGVWTELQRKQRQRRASMQEAKQEEVIKTEPSSSSYMKPFDEAEPTVSHLILKQLCLGGYVRHIVSQNVDGLFLKSNLPRKFISELHGNFYLDECTRCRSRFIRSKASETMRLQRSSVRCLRNLKQVDICKGYLRDTILDWESPIPYNELRIATRESKLCKLHLCIGTSLQLKPSKELVAKRSQASKKLVIINLQPTQFDKDANLVINYYADKVMLELAKSLALLGGPCEYNSMDDPTKDSNLIGTVWLR